MIVIAYMGTNFNDPSDNFDTQLQFLGTVPVVSYDFLSIRMNLTQFNTQSQYIGTQFITHMIILLKI